MDEDAGASLSLGDPLHSHRRVGASSRRAVRADRYARPVTSHPQIAIGRRLIALLLLLCAIAAGIGIHDGAPQGTVSDIAGDVLYAVAAYLAVVIVAPRLRPLAAGAIAAGWCVAVELFQLTGIPLALGAVFPPAMLVLGTVFDARDIALYLGTAAVLTAVDTAAQRVARRARTAAESPRA